MLFSHNLMRLQHCKIFGDGREVASFLSWPTGFPCLRFFCLRYTFVAFLDALRRPRVVSFKLHLRKGVILCLATLISFGACLTRSFGFGCRERGCFA